MSDKIHTIVIVRNGKFNSSFTAETVEELRDYLPTSMHQHLEDAMYYGQKKFYQGCTKYNLLYTNWNIIE